MQNKIGLQVIALLFESVSSSIEVSWGASDLLCAQCRHIHSPLLNKIYILAKNIIRVLKKVCCSTEHVEQVNGAT